MKEVFVRSDYLSGTISIFWITTPALYLTDLELDTTQILLPRAVRPTQVTQLQKSSFYFSETSSLFA